MSTEELLQKAYQGTVPDLKKVWITEDMKKEIATLTHSHYNKLRARYWRHKDKSVWIMNEIGKERPITIGIIIENQKILSVDIMEFRESRGWEVKHPFFTEQFRNIFIKDKQLSHTIDGVTGATLSVAAVKRASLIALYLSSFIDKHEEST